MGMVEATCHISNEYKTRTEDTTLASTVTNPTPRVGGNELTALLRRQPFAPSLSEGTTPVDTFIEQSFSSRGGIICNLNDRSAPPPVQSDHWSDTGSDYQKGKYFETIY
jgi:hypothetical protein